MGKLHQKELRSFWCGNGVITQVVSYLIFLVKFIMLKIALSTFGLLLLLLVACTINSPVNDELTVEEALPRLESSKVESAVQRRNKIILTINNGELELKFNARRVVNANCTALVLSKKLVKKLARKYLPDSSYIFKVTCFDKEGKPAASGEKKVKTGFSNPVAINIELKPIKNPPNKNAEIIKAFKSNYALWQKHSIKDYQITFKRTCFCLRKYILPANIAVENGKKVKVVYAEDGKAVPEDYINLTIKQVFELIAEAIKKEAELIKVTYDEKYGFPVELYIDYSTQIADEEIYISLTNFKPKSPTSCNTDNAKDTCKPPLPTNCQPYSSDSKEYPNNSLQLLFTKSLPPQISACLRSTHSNSCTKFISIVQTVDANTITLKAVERIPPNVKLNCDTALTPYARFIKLDTSGLKTGKYTLQFLGTMRQIVETSFYYQSRPRNTDCKPYSYESKEYQNAVNTIELVVLESFPIQLQACLQSTHSDTCIEFISIEQVTDLSNFTVTLKAVDNTPDNVACGDALTPYAHFVSIDTSSLVTGDYKLIFLGTMRQEVSTTFDYQTN